MTSSFISEMTSEAFREAAGTDTVAVIPMGSTELEGPHLPLGVDTIAADGVAKRLNGEPGVLIGPTLSIGYSKWFLPFAGTISLETSPDALDAGKRDARVAARLSESLALCREWSTVSEDDE